MSIFHQDETGIWEEISLLNEGIGERLETICSVRFNKEIVTIVTYRSIDPLYYIDLSNPTEPIITSELKISGYSVYQHPYQDNYVIGIGYESEGSLINGYKIALFDISDASHIVQVGNPYIFDASDYDQPAVLSNPKELFLDLENDIFGFSITDSVKGLQTLFPIFSLQNTKTSSESQRKNYYYIFKIDVESENPIQVIFEESSKEHSFKRMTFIGDYYYLLARNSVYSYQMINDQMVPCNTLQLF